MTGENGSSHRIVAGVDGSPSALEALRWAAGQAQLTGASVDAVVAWQLPEMTGGYAWPPAGLLEPDYYAKAARRMVTDSISAALGAAPSVTVSAVVREGNPARVLLDAASGADLLVVGSRGRGGFAEALLGSVSQHCAHHADCPVVIIRGPVRAGHSH